MDERPTQQRNGGETVVASEEIRRDVALVSGASRGIGLEFVRQLLLQKRTVVATCRNLDKARTLQQLQQSYPSTLSLLRLDVTDESTIEAAADQLRQAEFILSLILNVAGVLHDEVAQPEKKLASVSSASLHHVFAVNAFGPLLVAKHFAPLLTRTGRGVLASLSARVGSIGDNRLGGWYAYRASKAAQNMFTKNLAIELARTHPNVIVLALHPGTVDTALSKPFQQRVPSDKLFTTERAVGSLLKVVAQARAEDTGAYLDYDGRHIEW